MKSLALSLLLVLPIAAKTYYPCTMQSNTHDDKSEIIINSIYEELIKITKDLEPPKHLKEKKISVNNMSRGKKMIEEMKRRNREKLAKMRGINPDKVKSGADIVKAQQEDNKKLIKEIHTQIKDKSEWKDLAESEIEKLKAKVIADWKEKHKERILKWEEEKKKYNKEKGKYEDNTFELPLILPVEEVEKKKKVEVAIKRDYHIVPTAMSVPIRDQKFRPTCAAFAGVRLVEVLLAQNGKNFDLSEQYFYWASKEDCQTLPCTSPGSWVGHGFEFSSTQNKKDIPLEKDCPYTTYSKQGNETQIPLKDSCNDGIVKVEKVNYLKNLDQVMQALDKNQVVVASMKLTPNYYTSSSLVLYKNRNIGDKMDAHAQGHSMVVVGYVKLPQVLDEGSVCFIIANSWGEGWGQGGHACISEKWLLNQRQVNPFVVINSIKY